MGWNNRLCNFDHPDCFNCPYDDCIATLKDIAKQSAAEVHDRNNERNDKIIELWNSGMDQKYIAERMNLTRSTVSNVVVRARKNGLERRLNGA